MTRDEIAHVWHRVSYVDYCHYRWERHECTCGATKYVRVERELDPDEDYFNSLFGRPDSCPRCAELMGTPR